VTYTTKAGDNLWRIATDHCGSGSAAMINQIMALNNLSDDRIHPNMTLKLPKTKG
jgi:LysM repeat protein